MQSKLVAAARAGAAGAFALVLTSCFIWSRPAPELNVPFFSQKIDSFDCGPATVQMWAGYDRGTANLPSQQQISQFMGGTTFGTHPRKIADAVNFYTFASDARWDFAAAEFEEESFFSRQITSINSRRPVIAIIDGGFHAVIVIGGTWHPTENGYRIWDYTHFHDPLVGPRIRWASATWIPSNCPPGGACQQIVEWSAIAQSGSNLSAYGYSVLDSEACGGSGCINEEHQF
jgi:hypothetical protein